MTFMQQLRKAQQAKFDAEVAQEAAVLQLRREEVNRNAEMVKNHFGFTTEVTTTADVGLWDVVIQPEPGAGMIRLTLFASGDRGILDCLTGSHESDNIQMCNSDTEVLIAIQNALVRYVNYDLRQAAYRCATPAQSGSDVGSD